MTPVSHCHQCHVQTQTDLLICSNFISGSVHGDLRNVQHLSRFSVAKRHHIWPGAMFSTPAVYLPTGSGVTTYSLHPGGIYDAKTTNPTFTYDFKDLPFVFKLMLPPKMPLRQLFRL